MGAGTRGGEAWWSYPGSLSCGRLVRSEGMLMSASLNLRYGLLELWTLRDNDPCLGATLGIQAGTAVSAR